MRVLFTVQPATGHLHPLIPVVQAVEEAGHEVAICSSPSFEPAVEPFGFEYFGAGLDWITADRTTWNAFPEMPPPSDPDFPKFVVTVFADITARAMAPDVIEIATQWRPDVVVREMMEWGGYLASEKLGIPHASVGGNAYSGIDSPTVNYYPGNRHMVAEPLARHREALDLPLDPQIETAFRHLHMCFMPASWDRPDAPAPAHTRYFRHTSVVHDELLPEWADELPERPTVLAALGTVVTPATAPLAGMIVDALGGEDLNLIVAIGHGQDPAQFGAVPDNVHLEPHVPQAALLERCDLFLTHGGFNSVKEALVLGVPLVALPMMSDQPYSAERIAALGVGRVVPPAERTAEAIRIAALDVLNDGAYRERASSFREEMVALPGPEHAAEAIAALAQVGASRGGRI